MKPKKIKDLTPFSNQTLSIVGLLITLIIAVLGIILLAALDKEIMPLGTLAGAIASYFGIKGSQKDKTKCGVCQTSATYHTTEQCIQLSKSLGIERGKK
jgi:hypothetical protein